MKDYPHRILVSGIIIACMTAAGPGHANELIVPVNTVENIVTVETFDSRLAYPANIQVNEFKNSLEITGAIKRKRHNNQQIRGYVDVELVGANGETIDSRILTIKSLVRSARHDHQRNFSAIFARPESSDFSVRVRHHLFR